MKKMLILCLMFFSLHYLEGQQPSPMKLDAKQRETIITEVNQLLNQYYVYSETATKMAELTIKRLKNGEYDKLSDPSEFASVVFADLLSVSKDKHLNFRFAPEDAARYQKLESNDEKAKQEVEQRILAESRRGNFGFRKVERLAGNVGYLDFRFFASADQAAPTATAALGFLANCDAIIIDLRQNGGGDPTQIQFMSSYFFDKPTHLNDIYNRSEDHTENFWTLPYVPGPKLEKVDLYILTSSNTFSGAEEFSYNMKNLKRATLIGETTGGGAHPVEAKVVQNKFVLGIPYERAINPITKTNWEGTGVAPDIAIPADQAFNKAYAMALEKLGEKAKDPQKKAEIEWSLIGQKAKLNPVTVDASIFPIYAGIYQDRKVTIENGALFYQRTGPKYKLIPVTRTIFAPEVMDDFRLEFVMKDGKSVQVNGLYSDGSVEPSKRTN
jgi:hypothetical protein